MNSLKLHIVTFFWLIFKKNAKKCQLIGYHDSLKHLGRYFVRDGFDIYGGIWDLLQWKIDLNVQNILFFT